MWQPKLGLFGTAAAAVAAAALAFVNYAMCESCREKPINRGRVETSPFGLFFQQDGPTGRNRDRK